MDVIVLRTSANLRVYVGDTVTYRAYAQLGWGQPFYGVTEFFWTSDNPSVAVVAGVDCTADTCGYGGAVWISGMVSIALACGAGTANITASAVVPGGTVTGSIVITVE